MGWVLILCWLNLVCVLICVAVQNFYLLFLFFSTYEFIRTLFHRLFSTHLQAQFIHVLPSHPTAAPEKKKSPALWQGVNWLGHTACTSTRSRLWTLPTGVLRMYVSAWVESAPSLRHWRWFRCEETQNKKKAKTSALLPATPLTTRCCWISHAGPLNSRPHLSAALRTGTAARVTFKHSWTIFFPTAGKWDNK